MSQSKPEKSGRFKLLVIGVSAYAMGVLIWDMVGVGKAQRQMDQAKEKVETLKVEQAELQRQLAMVTSEEFAEEQIRDELLLAKPGETVVVVPQVAEVGKVAQVEQEKPEDLANWQKWVRLFL
jgi:cell division protein FtsB